MFHCFYHAAVGARRGVSYSGFESFVVFPQGSVKGLERVFFCFRRKQGIADHGIRTAEDLRCWVGNVVPNSCLQRRGVFDFIVKVQSNECSVKRTDIFWGIHKGGKNCSG